MGTLHYGSPPASFELDDRALAHIELVVIAKLRRNEPFAFTVPQPTGRTTLWIGVGSTLRFEYEQEEHEISRAWLDELLDSASTTAGLRVLPERAVADPA